MTSELGVYINDEFAVLLVAKQFSYTLIGVHFLVWVIYWFVYHQYNDSLSKIKLNSLIDFWLNFQVPYKSHLLHFIIKHVNRILMNKQLHESFLSAFNLFWLKKWSTNNVSSRSKKKVHVNLVSVHQEKPRIKQESINRFVVFDSYSHQRAIEYIWISSNILMTESRFWSIFQSTSNTCAITIK